MTPLATLAIWLIAQPALNGQDHMTDQSRHAACLQAINHDVDEAYEDALAWRHQGGGWPAEHCVSLALIALGHEAPGALRLRQAAINASAATPLSQAIMLGQSGEAFLQAEEYEQALESFTLALERVPDMASAHTGIAQARWKLGDGVGAEIAATAALALSPDTLEARKLRARARLSGGDFTGALNDVETARRVAPEDIEVLRLRGDILNAQRSG